MVSKRLARLWEPQTTQGGKGEGAGDRSGAERAADLVTRAELYMIAAWSDRRDFLGGNSTWNTNGYLKKVAAG